MSVRRLAWEVLTHVFEGRRSLGEVLENAKNMHPLSPADQGFLQILCYQVCRYAFQIDALLAQFLQKPLRRQDSDIQQILRLGAVQLWHLNISAHAALAETMKLVPRKKAWAKGLVNAVLHKASALRWEEAVASLPLSEKTSHPGWLVEALQNAWPDSVGNILVANNVQAPMTLRVNRQKCIREQYWQLLQTAQIEAGLSPFAPDALILGKPVAVTALPHFAEGFVSVQDEAAQQAAYLLDVQPGQRVLDACAAPGGKTCHLLERCPTLRLTALDNNPERLARIQENLTRLQLQAILKSGDATRKDWWDGQLFDRILLDAPCSATGVIRRHPDIKILRRPEDIPQLAKVQLVMLKNLWSMLKPGGKLLYATCSVLPQENEEVIASFLHSELGAHCASIDSNAPNPAKFGWQLFPEAGGHDGFYYALLEKTVS